MSTITLSAGNTHYEVLGPQDGPPVVLVHGISIPMWCWDVFVPMLVQAGFRVLRYDEFGRGQSDYPRLPYDRALLSGQLLELIDALGWTQPLNLVGFSFGGALAAHFTSLHPARVRRLGLLAPFSRMKTPDPRRVMRLPLIGEGLMRFKVKGDLIHRAQGLLAVSTPQRNYMKWFEDQVARPEFARAFLSILRTDGMDDYGSSYAQVADHGTPCIMFWGTQDEDIPRESIAQLRELMPATRYIEVEGADHGTLLDPARGALPQLIDFLKN